MTKTPTPNPAAKTPRMPWTPPRVARIDAGQAEIGTRATGDGAFTTS
ncbi:hypothetical protein [Sphingomonas sp. SUN039]|nr:hypothetical protein [Sphingomonas sp. SUN039]UVO55774.1 hypothetical protein M0209_17265 [Sphingomonas sp. SUN039]UVO55777.1 hypothetical protein M0209_17280 [Sphingomonas sp. SUN039]